MNDQKHRSAWLSLSGHRLIGDRFVRFAYLDEAGVGSDHHEPVTTVAGPIVNADTQLRALEDEFDALIDKHIPSDSRAGFVFTAKHLFNGGGPVFDRKNREAWPLAKRLEIADDIARIPGKLRLPIVLQHQPKSEITDIERYGARDKSSAAHLIAFMSCAMQVEQWMRHFASHEVCALVSEHTDNKSLLGHEVNRFRTPSVVALMPNADPEHFPFKTIKQSVMFEQKDMSKPLQLADFCAYVTKRLFMGDPHAVRFVTPLQEFLVGRRDSLWKWP